MCLTIITQEIENKMNYIENKKRQTENEKNKWK